MNSALPLPWLISFKSLVLPDAVLDVDHVVAHLQVAEIGEKCGSLRLVALRTRDDRLRLIEQIARAQDGEVGVGERDAIGDVSLGQRGGKQFAGEIGSFVGVTFSAAGAAAQAERNSVLAENVGQALDFAGVGDGNQDCACSPRSASSLPRASSEPSRGSGAWAGCEMKLLPRNRRCARFQDARRRRRASSASFCHHSSGERYRSAGRTRLPTPLLSWACSMRDQT